MGQWEIDLGQEIREADWRAACEAPSYLADNASWEMPFKILHRLHITLAHRHKMNPNLSSLGNKSQVAEGTLTHCFWRCFKVQQFWSNWGQSSPALCTYSRICLQEVPQGFKGTPLLRISLHCARKCTLLQRITDTIPSMAQWISIAKGVLPNEAYSTALRDKPVKFERIWGPFLKY